MTKVIILGEAAPKKAKKPIHFTHVLNTKKIFVKTNVDPNIWDNIELVCRDFSDGFDTMFAYDKNRNEGVLFLGHFNDGVVE